MDIRESQRLTLTKHDEMLAAANKVDVLASTRETLIISDQVIWGEYPVIASSASGPRFTDPDGNEYLDFLLSYGTVILGHADRRVDDAVIEEIRSGFSIGLIKSIEVELARELCNMLPGAEKVMFFKTGSDATGSAVRLARQYTGRDRVIRWGYNGWHDWCAQRDAGIPNVSRALVDEFTYNDIESLRGLFAAHPSEVACVLMMPFKLEAPEPGFLEQVRDLAHENGALLVFDEMRSGFRMSMGGAQEYFGVTADLATFSKAMANGYAISALTGRADILDRLGNVHISSTFYVNSDSMAAALATIRALRATDGLSTVWWLGKKLQDGLRGQLADYDFPIRLTGYPPMPYLEFNYGSDEANMVAHRAFYSETIRNGIYLHPNHHWFIATSMTDADIDYTLSVTEQAFAVLARASR